MNRFILFFLFIPWFCFAQVASTDSLRNAIESAKDDTVKVVNLNKLSKAYSITSPQSAIHFANMAKDLSERLGYKKGVGYAYKNIGLVYYNQGTYVEAANYWQQSL